MAEYRRAEDGALALPESHGAIAQAANLCKPLGGGERALFRELLGDGVRVERGEHLLAGERRCACRIFNSEVRPTRH